MVFILCLVINLCSEVTLLWIFLWNLFFLIYLLLYKKAERGSWFLHWNYSGLAFSALISILPKGKGSSPHSWSQNVSSTCTALYGFDGSAQAFNSLLSTLLSLVEATPLVVFILLKTAFLFRENRGKREVFWRVFENFGVGCWGFYRGTG